MSSEKPKTKLPGWMEFLHADEEFEDAADLKLLPLDGRTYVWWLAKILAIHGHGIAGQACHLFERYHATLMMNIENMAPESNEWRVTKDRLKNKTPLLVAVCIQLAAKMCSAHGLASVQVLRSSVMKSSTPYSVLEINMTELDLFKTLGYRVPLWTNVEKGMMIAREVGITDIYVEAVGLTVDIAEYYRVCVQEQVHTIAFYSTPASNAANDPGPSTSSDAQEPRRNVSSNIRALHLIAGAILTALQYTRYVGNDPSTKLAQLTRAPPLYLYAIRDSLLYHIASVSNVTPPASTQPPPPPPTFNFTRSKRSRRH